MLGSSLKLDCALLLSTSTSKRKFRIHSVMSSERVVIKLKSGFVFC
jgi:hypothetical protein